MNKIVIYYSMSENVDYCAKMIANKCNADLLRIFPEKAYPDKGFKKFYWGGKSAVMAETPKIQPYYFDPAKYDMIIFGTPVWASTFSPPLRTFIKENREGIKGKKYAAFACCSGSGGNKALNKLREFLNVDEFVTEAFFLDPKEKRNSDEAIIAFAKALEK